MKFNCEHCQQPLEINDEEYSEFAGQTVQCPACEAGIVIPKLSSENGDLSAESNESSFVVSSQPSKQEGPRLLLSPLKMISVGAAVLLVLSVLLVILYQGRQIAKLRGELDGSSATISDSRSSETTDEEVARLLLNALFQAANQQQAQQQSTSQPQPQQQIAELRDESDGSNATVSESHGSKTTDEEAALLLFGALFQAANQQHTQQQRSHQSQPQQQVFACPTCGGTGRVRDGYMIKNCVTCRGTGVITPPGGGGGGDMRSALGVW